MIKYTTHSTSPISEPESKPNHAYTLKVIIIGSIACLILVGLLCFYFGKSQGKSEERLKQQQEQVKADIKAVDIEKQAEATKVLERSDNGVKAAKIIQKESKVTMPVIRDTTQEEELRYLKQLKP